MIVVYKIDISLRQKREINERALKRNKRKIFELEKFVILFLHHQHVFNSNTKLPVLIVSWLVGHDHPFNKRL